MHDVNVCRRRRTNIGCRRRCTVCCAIAILVERPSLNRAGKQHTLCAEEKITYIIERSLTAFASRHVGCLSFLYVEYYGTKT